MTIFANPSATDLLAAPPSTPFGTTQTVDTLGLSSAIDGSAGNPVTRVYYCVQNGIAGTITDTFTYGTGSTISGNPVSITRGAFVGPATSFSVSLSASSEIENTVITMTLTPLGGAWPAGVVLTPVANTLTGAFSPTTLTPSGTTAATCTFIPNNVATGSLSATASPTMTNASGGQADTSTVFTATTISSAVINTAGTAITLTFNQSTAITVASDFALTVNGSLVTITWAAPSTPSGTQTGTLGSPVYSGQTATYTTSSTAMTNPALAATASGVTVTNSSTVSAPANTTISFTGAAGAPTGNQVLTSWGGGVGTSTAGMTLDGSGDLTLGGTNFAGGLFEAIGVQGDGTFTANYKSGTSSVDIELLIRAQSGSPFNAYALTLANSTTLQFVSSTGGAATVIGSATVSRPASSISITYTGNSFIGKIDGTTVGTWTDSTYPTNGYVGLGVGQNNGTLLTSVVKT